MSKGKLIVIEGACDGIGKTTQYNMLKDKLINDGFAIKTHHFPSYNTPQGANVEKFLRGEYGEPNSLSPYFINELYAYDRKITWHDELKPYYQNGDIILLDRYTTSSIIYQSVFFDNNLEKKKFIDYVIDHEYNEYEIKNPDLVIFLSAPFEVVEKLKSGRRDNEGVINDVFERDMVLMKKIYDNGIFVANYLKWDFINIYDEVNNKMRSREKICEDIYKLVKKK